MSTLELIRPLSPGRGLLTGAVICGAGSFPARFHGLQVISTENHRVGEYDG